MHVALSSGGVIRRMFRIDFFTTSMLEMRFHFSSHNFDISKYNIKQVLLQYLENSRELEVRK